MYKTLDETQVFDNAVADCLSVIKSYTLTLGNVI